MNILFAVPYAPNLIRTRPFNLIRALLRRGHRITLMTLWENEQELEGLGRFEQEGARVVCARLTKGRSAWNAVKTLPTRIPLQALYCWQPELLREITPYLSKEYFDVIHIEHLRGAHYGLWLKSHISTSNSRPVFIWDSVDCISYLFEQAARSSRSLFSKLITRLELNRTRRYEGWLVGQFDRVLVTSSVDKTALERLATNNNQSKDTTNANSETIAVLPNGVDLDFFVPQNQTRESERLVLTGKMSYHANVTAALYFVNDVMPLIWAKRPNVQVWIVGKDPTAAVRQLAIRNPRHVIVTGTVPDIHPYLARATVAVCPVKYGAGIQNKVLEAMAMTTPVVATPQAISALDVTDGEHVLVGDGSEVFAQAVLRLLEDKELQNRIGKAGRQYVEKHHDWNSIARFLELVYQNPRQNTHQLEERFHLGV